MRRSFGVTLCCLAAAIACAHGAAAPANTKAEAPHHDRNTILAEDLRELTVSNLFEAVQRLHPEWLTPRNSSIIGARSANGGSNDVQVYVGMQRSGNTDVLKAMTLASAASLHFFSPSEAQSKFGNGNLNGVIQVVTGR